MLRLVSPIAAFRFLKTQPYSNIKLGVDIGVLGRLNSSKCYNSHGHQWLLPHSLLKRSHTGCMSKSHDHTFRFRDLDDPRVSRRLLFNLAPALVRNYSFKTTLFPQGKSYQSTLWCGASIHYRLMMISWTEFWHFYQTSRRWEQPF